MIILGVDQSYTSSGWVLINELEEVLDFGIVGTSKNDGDIFTRARIIVDKIIEIIASHPIDYVGIEGLAYGSIGDSTRDLAGLQFLIIDSLRPLPVEITAPTAVKALALKGKPKVKAEIVNGKRKKNNKKKEMFEALPEHLQKEFKERGLKITKGLYDVTDAYYIGVYTLRKHVEITK